MQHIQSTQASIANVISETLISTSSIHTLMHRIAISTLLQTNQEMIETWNDSEREVEMRNIMHNEEEDPLTKKVSESLWSGRLSSYTHSLIMLGNFQIIHRYVK